MTAAGRTETTPGEALVVVAVCFGWAIAGSVMSVTAGSPTQGVFTDASMLTLALTELVAAAVAIGVLAMRRYDVASLLPRPTWRDSGVGPLLVLATGLASTLAMLPFAAGHHDEPISRMVEAATISGPTLVLVSCVNGTFEEVFLLGFLQRGLARHGTSVALGVMLLVRLLYHVYQGPLGAVSILGFGAVQGLYFSRWNKLWPPVLAHIFWDIVAFLH